MQSVPRYAGTLQGKWQIKLMKGPSFVDVREALCFLRCRNSRFANLERTYHSDKGVRVRSVLLSSRFSIGTTER